MVLFGGSSAVARMQQNFLKKKSSWADEHLQQMNLREKIGQLFIAGLSSAQNGEELLATQAGVFKTLNLQQQYVKDLVEKQHIGGIIFLRKQSLAQQIDLTNTLQAASCLPLLVVEDLEWGLAMRIDATIKFPRNLTLGAMQDEQLVYEVGKEIGRECKAIGVHMNLAPVVDINTNPANPVINDRSFGCDKEKVARLGTLFMQGLQDAGILACAKHFPGHGDTAVDSHVALPTIAHAQKRLWAQELYPFTKLIDAGVDALMSAHLQVPTFDAQAISTISYPILTDLLQKKMGFTGLVVTDALNMGALKGRKPGELELQALLAGNDILLMSVDIPKAIDYLVVAVQDGRLSEECIDKKVLKILQAKEYVGLHKKRLVPTKNIEAKVNTAYAQDLKKQLYADAVTLIADERLCESARGQVPWRLNNFNRGECFAEQNVSNHADCIVQIGGKKENVFIKTMVENRHFPLRYIAATLTAEEARQQAAKFKKGDTVVVAIYDMQKLLQKNFGIAPGTVLFVEKLKQRGVKVILVLFGSPYSIKLFSDQRPIIVAYEDDPDAQLAAANVLLGKQMARGQLPVGG